jgi:hypothetical protein
VVLNGKVMNGKVMNESGCERMWLWTELMHSIEMCLGGLRKTTEASVGQFIH